MATGFNGTTQYTTTPDAANLNFGSGDFTLMGWVYKRANSSGFTNTYFVSKWNTGGSAGTNEWIIALTDGGSDNKPVGGYERSTTLELAASPDAISLNVWNHLAIVRDGSTLRIYVNGVQKATKAVSGTMNDTALALVIAGHSPLTFLTNCIADDVRIYSRAVSANEIANHYHSGSRDGNVHGLITRYTQDETGVGAIGTDATMVDVRGNNPGTYKATPTREPSVLRKKRRAS